MDELLIVVHATSVREGGCGHRDVSLTKRTRVAIFVEPWLAEVIHLAVLIKRSQEHALGDEELFTELHAAVFEEVMNRRRHLRNFLLDALEIFGNDVPNVLVRIPARVIKIGS